MTTTSNMGRGGEGVHGEAQRWEQEDGRLEALVQDLSLAAGSPNLSRCDVHADWSIDNVCLITRQQLGQRRTGSGHGPEIRMQTYRAPEADFVLPMAPQVPQRLGGRRVQYRRP